MRNTCRATGRTYAAHYAVKGFFSTSLKVTSLCVCNVLHYVKSLSTSLCAGVASDAGVNFGIKLHHYSFAYRYFFNIIHLLYKGEERQSRYVHSLFNLGLTSETSLKLALALDSVYCCTSTAEAVTAAATAYKLIACVFHCAHNGKA